MKLASYVRSGAPSYGIYTDAGLVDIGQRPDRPAETLKDALGELSALAAFSTQAPTIGLDEVEFLPPVWNSDRIICAGLNYKEHIRELGFPEPEVPMLFVRFADSLVGHGQPIVRPTASVEFDFEGELAVVIGVGGRHIAADRASHHIAGYSCFNEGSLRDFQTRGIQFLPGKSFWRSGAFGPWLVTPDEAGDIGQASLVTTVNGVEKQRAKLDDLLFGVDRLIEFISTFMPLRPGDIIATGTPGGVAAASNPPTWLVPGDLVEIAIDGIGVLRNTVTDESPMHTHHSTESTP
ncbi:fumarylacetoacetate hydrolase family protein [Streptomyces sp. NPDC001514]